MGCVGVYFVPDFEFLIRLKNPDCLTQFDRLIEIIINNLTTHPVFVKIKNGEINNIILYNDPNAGLF